MKVLLGMSGGVDSSVSAILLKEQGYEVIGATMTLWEGNKSSTIEDAKKVCEQIGIQHVTMDCESIFEKHVIQPFISCYQKGETPNPCVECNKYLKFGAFYQKALELGCDFISTGHYAKVEYSEQYKQYVMKKAASDKKDQTYFLYGISKEMLPKMLFPLAEIYEKEEVRKIAQEHHLQQVAHKKDSEEICFIPDKDYANFVAHKGNGQSLKAGDIVLENGTVLGKHKGFIHYTIGQRKGLGVSYSHPLYVIGFDFNHNRVIVGEEKDLYRSELQANELNLLVDWDAIKSDEIMAKIRYRAKEAKARVQIDRKQKIAKVIFEEPQRAITPGQSVVFYDREATLLGGGKIIS